jgi:hypothetical protein
MYYHVTPTENVSRIMSEGLVPQTGGRSKWFGENEDAIYLFKTMEAVENALMNWLDVEFGDEPLTLLGVELPPNAKTLPTTAHEFELMIATPIPPEYLQIISEDI